jgi:hypothetical protein
MASAAGLRPPVQGMPDNSKQNVETAEKKPEEMQNVIWDSKRGWSCTAAKCRNWPCTKADAITA